MNDLNSKITRFECIKKQYFLLYEQLQTLMNDCNIKTSGDLPYLLKFIEENLKYAAYQEKAAILLQDIQELKK